MSTLDRQAGLVRQLADPSMLLDRNGRIVAVNTAACELFGYREHALVGQQHDTLFSTPRDAMTTLELSGEDDEAVATGVWPHVSASHRSGALFDARCSVSAIGEDASLAIITPLTLTSEAKGSYLELLRQLTESAVDATIVIDAKGIVCAFNAVAEEMFGYPRDRVIGENVSMLMPEDYATQHDDYLGVFHSETLENANRAVGMRRPVVARTSSGVMMPVRIALSQVQLPGCQFFIGAASRLKGDDEGMNTFEVVNDLIERRTRAIQTERDEFERLSAIDPLTQLANRREFDTELDRELRRSGRDGQPTALMMLDLDHFKLFNDHYGHPAGDECLQRVSTCLRRLFRRGADLVARYGGEEFVVILGGTNFPTAMMLAERLREAIAATHIRHANSPTSEFVTASIGVAAVAPSADNTPAELIEWADAALYKAKNGGRNRVHGDDHGGESTLLGINPPAE